MGQSNALLPWQLPACCVRKESIVPLNSALTGLHDHDAAAVLQAAFDAFCDQLLPQLCLWGARHDPCQHPISVRLKDFVVLCHGGLHGWIAVSLVVPEVSVYTKAGASVSASCTPLSSHNGSPAHLCSSFEYFGCWMTVT